MKMTFYQFSFIFSLIV